MAWQTMVDLANGDVVDEVDMDALRENILYNRSPVTNELFGVADFNTSSASYVDVTGTTLLIETTGTTLRISISGGIKTSTIGQRAIVTVSVDGVDIGGAVGLGFTADSQPGYPFGATVVVTGLTPGLHTVKMRAKNVTGATTTLYGPNIQVVDGA